MGPFSIFFQLKKCKLTWHNLSTLCNMIQQLDVPNEMKVEVDFTDKKLPQSARIFMPIVFKDGDSYCVVLGPDPQEGVFGCGKTTVEALKDWDKNLQKKKDVTDPNDDLAFFINEVLERERT